MTREEAWHTMRLADGGLGTIVDADGIAEADREMLARLVDTFVRVQGRNDLLDRYFEEKIPAKLLNVAVPKRFENVDVSCPLARVAVSSVTERCKFDGFTFPDGDGDESRRMLEISQANCLPTRFSRALVGALKYGCAFATVGLLGKEPVVRWHTAKTATALYDHAQGRDGAGFAIVGRARTAVATGDELVDTVPSKVDFYVDGGMYEIDRDGGGDWHARWVPDAMGRPRIVSLVYQADDEKPYGHSRLTRSVRASIDSMMRTNLQLEVAREYASIPQKAVMGLTDDQFDAMAGDKWKYAADSVLLTTRDPETGDVATIAQFPQVSMDGLLAVKRSIASDFCTATSIPLTELNLSDTTYTSAESLAAGKDKLISHCEDVNASASETMRTIALMLMAVDDGCAFDALTDTQRAVGTHFRNPATPSMAAMADFTVKVASAIQGFGQTTVAQERLGFDQSERARLQSELRRIQARMGAPAFLERNRDGSDDNGGGAGQVPQGA